MNALSQTSFVFNVWVLPVDVWNNPVISSPLWCRTVGHEAECFLCSDALRSTVSRFSVSCLHVDSHLHVKLLSEITSPPFRWLLLIRCSLGNLERWAVQAAGGGAEQWGCMRWGRGVRARPPGTEGLFLSVWVLEGFQILTRHDFIDVEKVIWLMYKMIQKVE